MSKTMKILVLTNLFPTPWDPLRGAFNRQQFERLGQRHEVDVLVAVDFRERLKRTLGATPGYSVCAEGAWQRPQRAGRIHVAPTTDSSCLARRRRGRIGQPGPGG